MDAPPRLVVVYERCPECDGALRVRRNNKTQDPFVGCNNYPECHFTEDYDDRLQRLADRMLRLEAEVASLREAEQKASEEARPAVDLKRGLTDLTFRFHPDRNPGGMLDAHTVTAALLELRNNIAA